MSRLLIKGGRPLCGEVRIKAAKNAVLPILAASLLTKDPCEICDVPALADISNMLRIMQGLGTNCKREEDVLTVRSDDLTNYIFLYT